MLARDGLLSSLFWRVEHACIMMNRLKNSLTAVIWLMGNAFSRTFGYAEASPSGSAVRGRLSIVVISFLIFVRPSTLVPSFNNTLSSTPFSSVIAERAERDSSELSARAA